MSTDFVQSLACSESVADMHTINANPQSNSSSSSSQTGATAMATLAQPTMSEISASSCRLADSFSNSRDCISNDSDASDNEDELNEAHEMSNEARVRRASSHSLIGVTGERICSSPINPIKMSTRVRQIKIDEGIEPHLSREIRSEREIQNTLKLKSSYDELILDNLDDECSSSSSSKFKRYRTCSESLSNIPAQLSPHYSNAPSPTSGILTPSRSFSPSISFPGTINSNANNNKTLTTTNGSPSPSPTRKLFITRQSTSPVVCQLRPSILQPQSTSVKRKLSDADSDVSLLSKRMNVDGSDSKDEEKFAHPLIVNTPSPSPTPTLTTTTSASLLINSKYTFVPIQSGQLKSFGMTRPSNINIVSQSSSPLNSPAQLCDSPLSVQSMSSDLKPIDSGYQSSVQNNSDSESCTA